MVFLLVVAVLYLGNVLKAILDQVMLIIHIRGLKLFQPDLNEGEAGHLDAQLLLGLLADGDEFVEDENGLWLRSHNLSHVVHDAVHALHYTLFIVLHV